MPSYRNGQIPENLLVVFQRGWNRTDGDWYHALSPATYTRHLALVARAFKRTGRTLQITEGFGAYRPFHAQVIARNLYGNGAALPGTSSHGGFWEGRQTLAMDYGNWAWVYANHGGFAAFKEDCAAVGLWAGAIMPERGYPREEWHVVDPNPWSAVPAFDGIVTPFNPAHPEPAKSKRKRKQMSTGVIYTTGGDDKSRRGAIVNTESGFFSPFSWFDVAYADRVAVGFGLEKAAGVSAGAYDQIAKDCAAIRKG